MTLDLDFTFQSLKCFGNIVLAHLLHAHTRIHTHTHAHIHTRVAHTNTHTHIHTHTPMTANPLSAVMRNFVINPVSQF